MRREWNWITVSILSNSFSVRCPVRAEINMISAYGTNERISRTRFVYSFTVWLSFSTASHLLTAMIRPFPRSWAMPAIFASCSVTPSTASIIKITTSERSIAATVLIILYLSKSSLILFFLLIPAVSINTYSFPSRMISVSIASLVVPAISDTITRFLPTSLFTSEDFPAFGFPTIAIFGRSSSASSNFSGAICSSTASSISPIPSFEDADTG